MYSDLGQCEQALEKFKYAMAGCEQLFGPEHEDTLSTLYSIG